MASIFKIRRGAGTASPSLTDGELYVNYDSSLQYASGSTTYTLLPLNKQVNGNIELNGNVTASNAYFTNNVRIDGNIILGDGAAGDTIQSLGVFTTNLVPSGQRDIGTTTATWANVYANNISASTITGSFSGSIAGINLNAINQFTASVAGTNLFTASIAGTNLFTASLAGTNTFTASLAGTNTFTASLAGTNTFTQSIGLRVSSLENYTASVSTSVGLLQATASFLSTTFSSSVDSRLDTLEGSATLDDSRLDALETYSASLKTAIAVSGQDLIIYGNLAVQGTQTSLNVNEVLIEDKNITLASGSTTAAAADGAGIHIAGANVTMSWDNANSRMNLNRPLYVSGDLSGSTLIGIGNVTTYSASVNSRLVVVEGVSASAASALNNVSGAFAITQAAQDVLISSLRTNILSASVFTTFSTSVDSRLDVVEATSSLYIPFSTSVDVRLNSLQSYTASVSTSVGLLQTSASLFTPFSTSVDARLDAIELYTGSVSSSVGLLQTSASLFTPFSTSVDARLDLLEITSSYLNGTFSQSVYTILDDHEDRIQYIEGIAFGGLNLSQKFEAIEASTASLSSWTGSTFVTFSTSVDSRLDNLESFSSSLDATFATDAQLTSVSGAFATTIGNLDNTYATDASVTSVSGAFAITQAAQDVLISSLRTNILSASVFTSFSTSVDTRLDTLEATTFSTSVDARLDVVEASASLFVPFSTSVDSRLDNLEGKDIIINLGGDLSGSAQSTDLGTITLNGFIAADSVALGTDTSGSYIHTITGTSNQITVAGSGLEKSDVTLSLPQNIHAGANVQFNSIGVGTTATGNAGEIRATGDITAFFSSDIRLKENITPITNALEKVNQISGNIYDWKEGYDEVHSHKGNDVGVIAQEIEQILPQIVTNRDNGYKAVQYEKIIPLLIEAVKELSAKVDRLENK
jgi:hypothetical protein